MSVDFCYVDVYVDVYVNVYVHVHIVVYLYLHVDGLLTMIFWLFFLEYDFLFFTMASSQP